MAGLTNASKLDHLGYLSEAVGFVIEYSHRPEPCQIAQIITGPTGHPA